MKILILIPLMLVSLFSLAANDPSINGELRQNIQQAMSNHIKTNKINEKYALYDEKKGKVLKLQLAQLHEGIVSKGDYYVSCADFTDDNGQTVDVDFMVSGTGNELSVYQAIIHKDDDGKRKYHLED